MDTLSDEFPSLFELQDRLRQSSPAKKFLASLPVVKSENLPENYQTCHICKELFDNPVPEEVENPEFPVKLPCNHIMGSECLAKWFDGHKSCPMCRTILFGQNRYAESPRLLSGDLMAITGQVASEEQRDTLSTNAESLPGLAGDLMAVMRQRVREAQWDVLPTGVAGNSSNAEEFLRLSVEINELLDSLGELLATEETEESSRGAEIMALFEQVEARIQGMRSLRRAEGQNASREWDSRAFQE